MSYNYQIDLTRENRSHSKLIKLVEPGKNILDIGCAGGHMSRYLRDELHCRPFCIEIDPAAAEKARPCCEELVVGDAETLDLSAVFSRAQFDIIILSDVIEHCRDAEGLLARLPELIAPGGYLLLSVPNGAHGSLALEVLDGHWQYRSDGLLDRSHLHFFDKDRLTAALEAAGFHISRLQRVIIHPRDSEMKTPWGNYPREITAYLEKVNPEFSTYQFIIKAYPADRDSRCPALQDQLIEERERLAAAGEKLAAAEKEIKRLREVEAGFGVVLKETKEAYQNHFNQEMRRAGDEMEAVRTSCEARLADLEEERTARQTRHERELREFNRRFTAFKLKFEELSGCHERYLREITELEQRLAGVEASRAWRLIRRLRKLIEQIFPQGSWRRQLYRAVTGRGRPPKNNDGSV